MKKLWIDRETYAPLDLKVVGTYRYAEEAEDLLVAYAIDDEPAQVWDATQDIYPPDDLVEACETATEVWAHNATFDKAIHKHQTALPPIELTRWRCSMALALVHALPGKLETLCTVLGLPEEMSKLKEGKKLIQLFTREQPANRKVRRATCLTHPAEWERFKEYALGDIVSMRECVRRMPRLNFDDATVAEWHCDQRINERGFAVDLELVHAGQRAAVNERASLANRFAELSEGQFTPGQRAKFQAYLNERYGLDLDDTKSDTFQQLLKHGTLPAECAEMMRISIASNKTSTAKYAALAPMVQADGRFRGALQFAGAGRTRRWAGRGPQFQNLPSRGLPPKETVDEYIQDLKDDVHEMFHENLMLLGAAALRGIVIAGTE